MTTKPKVLSETFIPDIRDMAKEFNRIMTRDEHRRFMNALKLTDFNWTELVIEETCERLSTTNNGNLEKASALQRRWLSRIKQEGGTGSVIRLSLRMSREGRWPWWGNRRRPPALIP